MDLRRERKHSLKLREMEQAQEEDRKARQKSTNEMAEEKRQQNTLAQKRYNVCRLLCVVYNMLIPSQ